MTGLITAAEALAIHAHAGQRYGELPYTYHLESVASHVRAATRVPASIYDQEVIAAAWLHDAIEDTELTRDGISQQVSPRVARIVDAVTDGTGSNRAERKLRPYRLIPTVPGAVLVKVADRLANLDHCLRTGNTRLMRMYVDEHGSFCDMLRGADRGPGAVGIWSELDRTVERCRMMVRR